MPQRAPDMKRVTAAVIGVAAMALWTPAALAQGRNFTGKWLVDSERTPPGVQLRSDGAGYETAGPPAPMPIALDSTSFTVGPTKYRLDGSTTFEGPNGAVTVKASWKGDKLVLEESMPEEAW
jgi:hypothetical protein